MSVLPLALASCVIPPSLSVSEDAGVNSPPAILSVSSDQVVLPEPGPVAFEIGGNTDLSVSLIDTDADDTLYVRIFVDYNSPDRLDARSKCTAGSGAARRTATCNLRSLCASTDLDPSSCPSRVAFTVCLPGSTNTSSSSGASPAGLPST